jgi:hypothetical protein
LSTLAPDLLLPLTVLVEEGKHASAPDRNGDGAYTPGYDVNFHVSEAWGVRDNFGSGLILPKYAAEATKMRNPRDRVFPPLEPQDPLRQIYCSCSSPRQEWPSDAPRYELRPTPTEGDARQEARAQGDRFGKDPRPHSFVREAAAIVGTRFAITARWNQPIGDGWLKAPDQWAWTLPGWRPGPLPVWLVPRVIFPLAGRTGSLFEPQRFDALVMPSASRWFDIYISLYGYARHGGGSSFPRLDSGYAWYPRSLLWHSRSGWQR